MLSRAAALALVLLALLLGGCRGDGGETVEAAPLSPELETILRQVAGLRGLDPPAGLRAGPVPRSRATEVLASTLTDSDRDNMASLTTLYRLLGHLGPEDEFEQVYLDFLEGAIIGFYAPTTKQFYIVEDGDSLDPAALSPQQRSTLAHEFVHALQDHRFGLLPLFEKASGDLDWTLALNAVLEGDAVLHEGLWAREFSAAPRGARLLSAARALASVPPSIEREFRFPYTAGLEWVSLVSGSRGTEAINGILSGRRVTTAEILHPELYESGWSPAEVKLPDLAKGMGEGWSHESGGAFGEFQLRNYLQLHLPGLPAVGGASGWAGDRYDVYRKGGSSVAVLRVRFAGDDEAGEFLQAHDAWLEAASATVERGRPTSVAVLGDGRTIIRTGGPAEVTLVIGSSRPVAERAFDTLAGG